MKLYATVASERAVKYQGGNKTLRLSLCVGSGQFDSHEVVSVSAYYCKEEGMVYVSIGRPHEHFQEYQYSLSGEEIKGEKQKGERICKQCGARVKTSLEEWHCSNCGADN